MPVRQEGNPGQGHLNAKYELKDARDIAFKQRKIDICAVRHFQQAETHMEKDKPFNLVDVRFFGAMAERCFSRTVSRMISSNFDAIFCIFHEGVVYNLAKI